MGKINILSFEVANLIAAGEVVDRPASVIKELAENAIDAGADRITVEIQNGGVSFMRVSDNGCGIEPEDLPVAVRRHATSKIKEAGDLDAILTLGFRGEALAAVAAVSDLRIISRTRGAPSGASIEVAGGDIQEICERGCSEGTTVIAENLFFNVPARRKFLKRDVTETAAVAAVVEKIALSHPEIAFSFIADGTAKIESAGDGRLQSAIYAIYGREFARGLIEVDYEHEGIILRGYAGKSENVKPNRNAQNFFINGRYVRSKTASAALEQAYVSYIPPEKFPVCVLNIEISPRAVDVNVHPAKLEVKFSNEKPVFEAIYYGVKNAIERNTARPDISPEKFSRMTYEEYRLLSGKGHARGSESAPEEKQSGTKNEVKDAGAAGVPSSPPPAETKTAFPEAAQLTAPSESNIESPAPSESNIEPPAPPAPQAGAPSWPKLTARSYIEEYGNPGNIYSPEAPATSLHPEPPPEAPPAPVPEDIPQYRIIGEGFNSYVMVETGDKLLFIDKHAAHERIIFERLKAGLTAADAASQTLMTPLEFMLTSEEAIILNEYREEIEKIGFSFEAEKYTVRVTALPQAISLSAVPDIFMTIADRIKNETGDARLTRDIIFEKALYQASCKAALKAGREYGQEHISWLVGRMMESPDITNCPHGRPVAMEINKRTLDRQFGRT